MAEQILAPLVGALQLGGWGNARPAAGGPDEDIHRPVLAAVDDRKLTSNRHRRAIAAHPDGEAAAGAPALVRRGQLARLGRILPPTRGPDEDIDRPGSEGVADGSGGGGAGHDRRAVAA